MRITGIIWLREVVDKLAWKHQVTTEEVDEALAKEALIVSAREMTKKEKRAYAKK